MNSVEGTDDIVRLWFQAKKLMDSCAKGKVFFTSENRVLPVLVRVWKGGVALCQQRIFLRNLNGLRRKKPLDNCFGEMTVHASLRAERRFSSTKCSINVLAIPAH